MATNNNLTKNQNDTRLKLKTNYYLENAYGHLLT